MDSPTLSPQIFVKRFRKMFNEIYYDHRLDGMQKYLILWLLREATDDEGKIRVSARRLAMFLGCHDKTAARHLRALQETGYIELDEEGANNRGGFLVSFRKASLLVGMLAILGGGPALHKPNYQTDGDLRSNGERNIYYMTTTEVQ